MCCLTSKPLKNDLVALNPFQQDQLMINKILATLLSTLRCLFCLPTSAFHKAHVKLVVDTAVPWRLSTKLNINGSLSITITFPCFTELIDVLPTSR